MKTFCIYLKHKQEHTSWKACVCPLVTSVVLNVQKCVAWGLFWISVAWFIIALEVCLLSKCLLEFYFTYFYYIVKILRFFFPLAVDYSWILLKEKY